MNDIARSLTKQTFFVNTEQRSVGSWLADRILKMLPGRPPPWIVGFLWAHFNPLPPWMGYCLQGTRAERGPYERWRTGRLTLILAFLPFARVRPHSIFDASPKVVVIALNWKTRAHASRCVKVTPRGASWISPPGFRRWASWRGKPYCVEASAHVFCCAIRSLCNSSHRNDERSLDFGFISGIIHMILF